MKLKNKLYLLINISNLIFIFPNYTFSNTRNSTLENKITPNQQPTFLNLKDFERIIKLDYHTVKSELLSKGWKLEFENKPNGDDKFYSSEFSVKNNDEFTYIHLYVGTDPKYHNSLGISLVTSSKIVFSSLYYDFKKIKANQEIRILGDTDPNNFEHDNFEVYKNTKSYGYGFKHIIKTNINKPVWSFRINTEGIDFGSFALDIENLESKKIEEEEIY